MSKLSQYTWELPQNLVGLFVKHCFGTKPCCMHEDAEVRYWPLSGSISLGEHIFLDKYYEQSKIERRDLTIKHEYGHTMQSRKLGWFYLLVIGLPSIVWAGAFKGYRKKNNVSYYSFYTEKWADKLGGVNRGSSN
jgi:hypothetical protein